jgi:hypothetical protein
MDTSKLTALAIARKNSAAADAALREYVEEYTQSPIYQGLQAASIKAQEELNQADEAAREAANADWEEHKEKHPVEGVEIKSDTTVEILNDSALLKWVTNNLKPALKYDVTKIKAAAKVGDIPTSLVKVTKGVKVYLAGDLSQYLPKEDGRPD